MTDCGNPEVFTLGLGGTAGQLVFFAFTEPRKQVRGILYSVV